MIRFLRGRRRRSAILYAIPIVVPVLVWFALMETYVAYGPLDTPLEDPGAEDVVSVPNGTTALEPRGIVRRNIAEWLDAHPQGVRSFEVGGGQFSGNTAELTPQSLGRISQLATMLKASRNVAVAIVGHSAAEGDDATSLQLSLTRAERVRHELIQYGVSAGRISVEGRGASGPIAPNDIAAGHQQNARVVIVLLHKNGAA